MTDQEAYRRYTANAEALLAELAAGDHTTLTAMALGSSAQTWAALALAAAQERVQPTNRPTEHQPARIKDGDGDYWTLNKSTGTYETYGAGEPHTLEAIARDYHGYTEVP